MDKADIKHRLFRTTSYILKVFGYSTNYGIPRQKFDLISSLNKLLTEYTCELTHWSLARSFFIWPTAIFMT